MLALVHAKCTEEMEEKGRGIGKLVPSFQLLKLFDECDMDKNGTLDVEEFTRRLANKYEIKWAEEKEDARSTRQVFEVLSFKSELMKALMFTLKTKYFINSISYARVRIYHFSLYW